MARYRIAVLSCLLLLAGSSNTSAQAVYDRAFVIELGADTLAIERFGLHQTHLQAEMLGGAIGRMIYSWMFRDGRVAEMSLQAWMPTRLNGDPSQTAHLAIRDDSVIVDVSVASRTTTQRFHSPYQPFPYLNPSIAQIDAILKHALERDLEEVTLFMVQGGQSIPARIERKGDDSVHVTIATSTMRIKIDEENRVVSGGVPGQNLRFHRNDGAQFQASVLAPPDYSAPEEANFDAIDVSVPTDAGHQLAGTLTLPQGVNSAPGVVMITGSGAQDRDQAIPFLPGYRPFRDIAHELSANGIAVLRLDDRGTGASTGIFSDATSADFADDMRAAVDFLRHHPSIDADRVGLIGHSEGGLIAPMIAADDPGIAAIVLIAGPAQTGRDIIRYQLRTSMDLDESLTPVQRDSIFQVRMAELQETAERSVWLEYFLDYDPLSTAHRVTTVPVFIVHGETDLQVTVDQAHDLATAFTEAGNPIVAVRTFPNINHLLLPDSDGRPDRYASLVDRRVADVVLESLLDWLKENL
jgi:uncharacterized protein